jgi:SAM-dependent MidA family methyltransferase
MTPLEQHIRREIETQGPISFRLFMELALYHPEHGYYRKARDPFGKGGDFFTNSQLQPVFGRLLAQQIARWRDEMGRPSGFTVVEIGAGRGETLQQVRQSLPDVPCVAVEVSSRDLPHNLTGVVYANEFFDALPVHVVKRHGNKLWECRVNSDEKGFRWVEGAAADKTLEDYIRNYAPGLAEGQKIEVNLDAVAELERIIGSMTQGYVLTIDYGYTAREIAGGRRLSNGSLMSYARHQASDDVLTDPGGRDITAHVNFTALEQRGEVLGLSSLGLKTQAQFLLEAGQPDEFREALAARNESEARQLRLQLKSLLFGMGETFQVLVQRKASYTPVR